MWAARSAASTRPALTTLALSSSSLPPPPSPPLPPRPSLRLTAACSGTSLQASRGQARHAAVSACCPQLAAGKHNERVIWRAAHLNPTGSVQRCWCWALAAAPCQALQAAAGLSRRARPRSAGGPGRQLPRACLELPPPAHARPSLRSHHMRAARGKGAPHVLVRGEARQVRGSMEQERRTSARSLHHQRPTTRCDQRCCCCCCCWCAASSGASSCCWPPRVVIEEHPLPLCVDGWRRRKPVSACLASESRAAAALMNGKPAAGTRTDQQQKRVLKG